LDTFADFANEKDITPKAKSHNAAKFERSLNVYQYLIALLIEKDPQINEPAVSAKKIQSLVS